MNVVIISVSTVKAELMAKDKSRTMTTRSASVNESSTSLPVHITSQGEGLGGAPDGESDNLSPYSIEDDQGTGHRVHDAGYTHESDGISDFGESTVNSLSSRPLSNADAINGRSEELSSPAGVGLEAPTSFGAGAHLEPAGSVSQGTTKMTAVVSQPPGPPPAIPRHQILSSSSAQAEPAGRSSFGHPRASSSDDASSNASKADYDSDEDAAALADALTAQQRAMYGVFRRQLKRAKRDGDANQVAQCQQLITQLLSSAISLVASLGTDGSASSSGSSGRPAHVAELAPTGVVVPKDMLAMIKASVASVTAGVLEKHAGSLGRSTKPPKVLAVVGTLVNAIQSVVPPAGAKLAALITVACGLPTQKLIEASVGGDVDLYRDTLQSLSSAMPRAPAEVSSGVHPFALLLSQYRNAYRSLLQEDVLLSRLDLELRPFLLKLFTVDVRDVSLVATADNCVQVIRQVFLQLNYHDNAQFNHELGSLNRPPPPIKPTGPYPVMSALQLLSAWYDRRVEAIHGPLRSDPEMIQLQHCMGAMPTGEAGTQMGAVFDDISSKLQHHLEHPTGSVRGHAANQAILAALIKEHANRTYAGKVIPAEAGGNQTGVALLGYSPFSSKQPKAPAKSGSTGNGPKESGVVAASSSSAGAAVTSGAAGKSSPSGASSSGSASAGRGASVPGERQGRPAGRGTGGKRGKSRSSSPPPREKCQKGEEWLTEQRCKDFQAGNCPKWHRRPRCNEGVNCAALKAGHCTSFHPKPEVEGVLGGLGEAAVKGYYKNLGYLALARRCSTARRVQFRLKPAVAFLPSKQVLRSARPDVADEALALKAPLLLAEQWAQPAKSVRRASSSFLGFRLKLAQPATRRRTLKALEEFSKHDESRRWMQASKAERKTFVCQGYNPVDGISLLKANAAYHQLPVPKPVEDAYARVTEPIVKPVPVSTGSVKAASASARAVALPSSVAAAAAAATRQAAGTTQVLLARTLSANVGINDSGANLNLANVDPKYLHNRRTLSPSERVLVSGINSTDTMLKEVANLFYAVKAVACAHEDELPALFGHVGAGAKPLTYYMSSAVYVHPELPKGLTILSVGKECRDKQMKCVIDGAPDSVSYCLTQQHGDDQLRMAFANQIGVGGAPDEGQDYLLTIPGLCLLSKDDVVAGNFMEAAQREWDKASEWYAAAKADCDRQQQLAALAAVSAQPLVFYNRVREPEEAAYSLTAKPYGFLAAGFRSHVPDDDDDTADSVSVEPGVSALLSEPAVADAACSSGSEDLASEGTSEVAAAVSLLDRLSGSMSDVLHMGAPALQSVVASCASACASACSYIESLSSAVFGIGAVCPPLAEPAAVSSSETTLASAARMLSCFMATKQSPSNLPALPSSREKPWVQPGSAGREAALCRGQDASFVDRVQLLRAKLASLRGPVVVVDVCSGGCSYSQLIPEYPNLYVINYDKVGPRKRHLRWRTPGNAARHAHVAGDVQQLTKAQIGADVNRFWGLSWANIVFVNLAPNCGNISTAPEFGSHPLRMGASGGWAPTTDQSIADDLTREWCFKLFHDIDVEEQGRVAIVFEHPAYGHLFDLPFIRRWLLEHKHLVVSYADACLLTFPSDGPWMRKSTVHITTPNVKSFELDCKGTCAHMVPGTHHHRCVIAPRGALKRGQVRVTDDRKSRYSTGHVTTLLAFADLRFGPAASASVSLSASAASSPLQSSVHLASCGGLPAWSQSILTAQQFHASAGHLGSSVLHRTIRNLKGFQLRLPDGTLKPGAAVTRKDLDHGPCDTCILANAPHHPSRHTNNGKAVKDMTPEQRLEYHRSVCAAAVASP